MIHHYHATYDGVSVVPMDKDSSQKYRIIRNEPDNIKWFFTKRFITKAQQKRWYENYKTNESELMFSIVDNDGIVLGGCGIYDIDWDNGIAEFGRICIDPSLHGEGIGSKAVKAIIGCIRHYTTLKCIRLLVRSENAAAISCYRNAGFECIKNETSIEFGGSIDGDDSGMIKMEILL